MPPTPQFAWPLLRQRTGVDVVVKHENHTPTGAFKVRGGIVYVDRLKRERPDVKGVITATRGNHGQSLALACARAGIACTVVVPFGNSTEKNAAMKAFGAELIEHGRDLDEALDIMRGGMERLIEVTDDEIAEAIRILYTDTHTLAEGAGAAAFAALMRERDKMRGTRAAVIVSGQNIDRPWMATVLAGGTPQV